MNNLEKLREDIEARCWHSYRDKKLLQAARILFRIRNREIHGRWPSRAEIAEGIAA